MGHRQKHGGKDTRTDRVHVAACRGEHQSIHLLQARVAPHVYVSADVDQQLQYFRLAVLCGGVQWSATMGVSRLVVEL